MPVQGFCPTTVSRFSSLPTTTSPSPAQHEEPHLFTTFGFEGICVGCCRSVPNGLYVLFESLSIDALLCSLPPLFNASCTFLWRVKHNEHLSNGKISIPGHEITATIAEILLTDKTRDQLCEILPPWTKCHLAPVAAWADKIKSDPWWRSWTCTCDFSLLSRRSPNALAVLLMSACSRSHSSHALCQPHWRLAIATLRLWRRRLAYARKEPVRRNQ